MSAARFKRQDLQKSFGSFTTTRFLSSIEEKPDEKIAKIWDDLSSKSK